MADPRPLTDADLDAIQARADAATPAPWHLDRCGERDETGRQRVVIITDILRGPHGLDTLDFGTDEATAKFVRATREDVPALVARVRVVEAERDSLREQLATVARERDGFREDFAGVELWSPRGIGMDYRLPCLVTGEPLDMCPNVSGFVRSREAGERVVAMLGGRARLDYRPREPRWTQVKVGVKPEHEAVLERLCSAAADGVLTTSKIQWALDPEKSPGWIPLHLRYEAERARVTRERDEAQDALLLLDYAMDREGWEPGPNETEIRQHVRAVMSAHEVEHWHARGKKRLKAALAALAARLAPKETTDVR